MKMKKGLFGRKALLVLSILVLGIAGNAAAIPIAPGGFVFTTGTTEGARPELEGTVIVDELSSFTGVDAFGNIRFTGTLQTRIVKEDVAGTLDFYFRIMNDTTSPDAIERMSSIDFAGFTTDVDWRMDSLGIEAPFFAQRSGNGSVVSFNFVGGFDSLTGVLPGDSSKFIFIKTDATEYKTGSTVILDGGMAAVKTYAPATSSVASVPEPSTLLLLGSGLLGLGRFGQRRKV